MTLKLAWMAASGLALAACGSSHDVTPGTGGPTQPGTGNSPQDNACLDKTPPDTWQGIAAPPVAPEMLRAAIALWTGTRLLIFPNDGGVVVPTSITSYDPCADGWTAPVANKPVLGGLIGSTYIAYNAAAAFRLDTTTMSWAPMSTQGGPLNSSKDWFEVLYLSDRLLAFGSLETFPAVQRVN